MGQNKLDVIYMLEEMTPVQGKPQIISSTAKGGLKFKAIFQDADTLNGNGKIYSSASLNDVVKLSKPLIARNAFVGEMNHPFDKSFARFTTIDLGNVSHRILDIGLENKLFVGVGQTLSNRVGKDMRALIEEDAMILAFSLRALGQATQGTATTPAVVQNVKKLIAYDWVNSPSHAVSQTLNLIEDVDVAKMLLASSKKLEFLREEMGNDGIMLMESDDNFNNIKYDANANVVKFCTSDSCVSVLLENHIANEFKNSFSKLC